VGGISHEVRGRTKIETWLKFTKVKREILERYEDSMHLRWPSSKKEAYEQMTKDASTGEWVLRYNFHT
jgi:hypothetical protein